ncbi:MAG: PilZ domain-containing protein [Candidatus Omnitrophota bacterium]
MGEQRKYMRFNVFMEAIGRTGDALKRFKVSNFSKEGVGILSDESLNEGEDVEVEMMIPGDNIPVVFEGRIAWTSDRDGDEPYKGGIRFKKICSDDKTRILEYIYHKWITPDRSK